MIKIENTKVEGFEPAIRGMRNPKNSWGMSDSESILELSVDESDSDVLYHMFQNFDDDDPNADNYLKWSVKYGVNFKIGDKDEDLCLRLNAGGPVHAKYRRQIVVWCNITAPLYWWKEFDTYKVGTVANSCSTMHKIHAKEFELSDFSTEHLIPMSDIVKPGEEAKLVLNELPVMMIEDGNYWSPLGVLKMTIVMLNKCRKLYLDTKDKKYWWQLIQLLPTSYNQKRTVMLNYEVLHNMYVSRKDHKLDEWHTLCDWIFELPYSELIIT